MKELNLAWDLTKEVLNNNRPNLAAEIGLRIFSGFYFKLYNEPPEVRYYVYQNIVPDAIAGRRRSIGEDGQKLLESYQKHVLNRESIPTTGALLVTPNHYSHGPLNSYWTHYLVASEIKNARENSEDIKFVAQDSLMIPTTKIRLPFSQGAVDALHKTYDNLLVTPPKLRENGQTNSFAQSKKILESFRNKEVIGLYPELKGTTKLNTGHWLAGYSAYAYFRITDGAPILPVGLFKAGGRLWMRIGEPYSSCEIAQFIPRTRDEMQLKRGYKKAAKYMMQKINPLVSQRIRNPKLAF